jgi:hypothetical protein
MPEEKKKNWFARHKILTAIIAIVVIIGFAGSGGSSPSSETSDNSNTEAKSDNKENVAEEKMMTYEEVNTQVMIDAFDDNQLAAEKTYKDKPVQITAKIKNISEDIMGTPFLSLEPSNADDYYFGTTIQCLFENEDDLLSVSNGQLVTVQGIVKEQSLGIIGIRECKIVE